MTDLNSLVIFAKVVEVKSFSEAARRLNIPISTVSRRIADLEDQLGVRLLERSTRNLRLTEVGSEVLEHAQRSVEISDAVDNVVSNQLSSVSGVLRLSAPPSISDSLLAPLVGAFQASYPNVRVQIFVTDRFVDHIAEGVDLVFRIGALKDSSLVARKLLSYRQQLVA
ncbi:LysR family transcriptional regulator, partial [Caballeronia mineralivorans]|uniref:LysR family transcriptional regulator n=1 Tax=Caballeronia mineralivorans TaxID=2010198 RepID=UPI002AFFBBCC